MRAVRLPVASSSLLALCLAVTNCASPAPAADWAIENVSVVDVAEARTLPDSTVLVANGRILAIQASGEQHLAPNTERIDGEGGFLLPGLIDMHVHLRHQGVLPLLLAHGVTTVRNMNGFFGHAQEWQQDVATGRRPGPRIVNASPTIRLDGDSTYPAAARTPEEATTLVQDLVAQGWEWLKVYQVPSEAFSSLADEAARLGVPVTGHIPWFAPEDADLEESRRAVLEAIAGMRTVEHMGGFLYGWFRDAPDATELTDFAEAVRATGVVAVTPVLGQDYRIARVVEFGGEGVTASERARVTAYAGEEGVAALDDLIATMQGGEPWHPDFQREMALALHRAGMTLLLGTDAHSAVAIAGYALHEEARLLQEGGMSPPDVLRAATVDAARVLGMENRLGAIAPGFEADFVVLTENPLKNVGALEEIRGVARAGQWHDRAEIERWLREARANPPYCRSAACN